MVVGVRRLAIVSFALILAFGARIFDLSSSREVRMWIGPDRVDCVGVGPLKCLLVKESEDTDWEFFYDGIEGFTYVEGVSYVLDVEITQVKDPPADGSSLYYRLVRVVEATPEGG